MIQAVSSLLVALLLSQSSADAEKGAGNPAPPKPAAQTPAKFPWDLNRDYRFSWIKDRKKVGETRFRIAEVASPSGSRVQEYLSLSTYWQKSQGSTMEGSHETHFDKSWRPIRYNLHHRYDWVMNYKSAQDQEGELKGGKFYMVTVHNKDQKNEVRPDPIPVPPEAYLLLQQSFDNYAILAADLLRMPKDYDAQILFPDFLKIYEVHYKYEFEEPVDLGKKEKNPVCRLYSFKSKEGQFGGKVWVDAGGRMVQYEQGNLRIYLED
jgi:hypothetical protein